MWLGSSAEEGVVSSKQEIMKCRQPEFDGYVCMTVEDQSKLLDTFVGCCEKWRPRCGESN